MRAAVVGAGLAGLSAAYGLRRAGAEVVVLEARERVGGRVWSRRLRNGAVVEMGAEFLLPGNTAIRELAETFGLGLCDKGMRYGRREPRGGTGTTADELEAAAGVVGAALAAAPPDLSARRLLDGLDIPAGAREALLARVEISSANSAADVAARDLSGIAHVDREPAPSIAGGNQRLALALADAVRLRSPVHCVAHGSEGVRVATAGAELEADACVIAVPASVVDLIAFDPPLPDPIVGALRAVRYGHAAKLFVPLRRPAPPSAVMSVPERWLQSLASLRPDLELDPSGAVLSTWSDDPWARAAYSTSPPPALAEAFARPIGPLAFAGEHLGGEFAALMEGAIRSGRRAASALLGSPSGAMA